jgi:zinc transport system substrate-binding protein
LDPTLAQAQARTIRDALMKLMPEGRADFTRNHDALTLALVALDQRFISITAPLEDRPLLYSHPVYQYFDSRYGLSGRALHLEPDQTVTRAQWLELRDVLAEHPATIMLWEAPPLDATKAQLEELGIEVVVFEPAGKRPDGLDFMQRQQANADNLRRAQTLSEPAQPKHTPK